MYAATASWTFLSFHPVHQNSTPTSYLPFSGFFLHQTTLARAMIAEGNTGDFISRVRIVPSGIASLASKQMPPPLMLTVKLWRGLSLNSSVL